MHDTPQRVAPGRHEVEADGSAPAAAPGSDAVLDAVVSSATGAVEAAGAVKAAPAVQDSRPPMALPVAVEAAEPMAAAVRSWCEGTLGWQVVAADGSDPVPAVVRLVEHREHAVVGPEDDRTGIPAVLLLADGVGAVTAAEAAARLRPAAVLRWPQQRDELPDLLPEVLATGRDRKTGAPGLVVGGSAGGVGTSTVALALGGLRAWSGTPTLVAVRGSGLSPRAVPTAALGAADLWAAADPRPGIEGLRCVRLADHAPLPEVVDRSVGSVVIDAGVATEVDVLVCRLDRAGAAALERTGAAVTVVVGRPLLPDRTVRELLGGRPVVALPWSARVARAGLRDRVPADLPGSFLDALRSVATGGPGRRAGRGGSGGPGGPVGGPPGRAGPPRRSSRRAVSARPSARVRPPRDRDRPVHPRVDGG